MVDCCAEGLGTLIELGKSQAEMQKQWAQETKTFEAVKRAIETGAIKKGMDKAIVLAKYGEPVVMVDTEPVEVLNADDSKIIKQTVIIFCIAYYRSGN